MDGNYAGPSGQSFVGRRQQDTFFTYSVGLDFSPAAEEEEAGVTVFLTQNHHLDLGIVLLPAESSTADFPGTNATETTAPSRLAPHVRFRGISSSPVPDRIVAPLPKAWAGGRLRLEIKASNGTHYSFSVGPADALSEMQKMVDVSNEAVSWGFTGASYPHSTFIPPSPILHPFEPRCENRIADGWLTAPIGTILGVYCTSNGRGGSTEAYFSEWSYIPQGQFRN